MSTFAHGIGYVISRAALQAAVPALRLCCSAETFMSFKGHVDMHISIVYILFSYITHLNLIYIINAYTSYSIDKCIIHLSL